MLALKEIKVIERGILVVFKTNDDYSYALGNLEHQKYIKSQAPEGTEVLLPLEFTFSGRTESYSIEITPLVGHDLGLAYLQSFTLMGLPPQASNIKDTVGLFMQKLQTPEPPCCAVM